MKIHHFSRVSRAITATGLALSLIFATSCAPHEAASPAEAVQQFYAMLDALGVHEVPDSLSLQAIRPFVADSLYQELSRISAGMSSSQRSNTVNEKASFKGDPFSSLTEGRTNARAISTVALPDTGLVITDFSNTSLRPSAKWIDTVVAIKEHGRWVVADIRYGTTWDYAFRGTLLDVLKSHQ